MFFRQMIRQALPPKTGLALNAAYDNLRANAIIIWHNLQREALQFMSSDKRLISRESRIGRQLFGEIIDGNQREFFNINPTTWVWYESWETANGQRRQQVVKYVIEPDGGVYKTIDNSQLVPVVGVELGNFLSATQLYFEKVMTQVYERDYVTGRRFDV